MKCPKCGSLNGKVVDSRTSREGDSIRRRRECLECEFRFTTYETIEAQDVRVVKADGRYQAFDRQKLFSSLAKACEKTPIHRERIEALVLQIGSELEREFDREIPSRAIRDKVMEQLSDLDRVAFVRYAAVYREFREVDPKPGEALP